MVSHPVIKQMKAYLAKKQWNYAIALGNETLKNHPTMKEIYPLLANAYAQQGQLADAISAYQKSLLSQGDRADIHAELALLYNRQKQLVQAVRHYQQAIAIQPNWSELHYNLAVIWHQLGDWEQSINAYQEALKIKPNYPAAYFNLGVIYDRRGDLEAAVENYQRAIELQPNNVRAYSNLGSTLAKNQKYETAIEILNQGLKLDPTWGTLHNNLGQVLWLNQQPDKALASFESALMLEPEMVLAHHNLSKLWQQKYNHDLSVAYLKRVIELEPNNSAAHSNCASVLLRQGKTSQAIVHLQRAIAVEPKFIQGYCQRAMTLESIDLLSRVKIACARLLMALQQNASKSQIYNYLWQTLFYWGDILLDYGGTKQAESYYRQALDVKPDEVELYLRLGNCLAKQQRLEAAIAMYQTGLTLQPNHPQICFQLGKLLEGYNQAESAIEYYETVLQQQSYKPELWQQLQQLFSSEEDLSQLPQEIYHYTHDWIRNCQLEDYHYVEVSWEGTSATANKLHKLPSEPISVIENTSPTTECAGVNCVKCMNQLIELFEPIQLGSKAYKLSPGKLPLINSPLPFVVTIPQGKAWIAPQKNAWIICHGLAIITPDGYLLGDLSRYYPWFLPPCPNKDKTRHIIYELDSLPPMTELSGKVMILSGLAGHVYYHWLFDILPRIQLVRNSGIELENIDWFVINNTDRSFQTETLNWLGIPLKKIIVSDRKNYIQAEELIVPSFPGYLDWIPLGTINFLRQTFLAKISLNQGRYSSRIYISRSQARARYIINEEEVIEQLAPLGFQTVFLEEMSVIEQVALFANAKVIVAAHGSGLSNLVFCSPDTTVIELFSPNYLRTDYWIIGQQLRLKYYYSLGDNFSCQPLRDLMYQNSLTEDILVNIKSLKLILKVAGISD